jgi:4-amino-4-deoxy-L-arabinose transferase-like glycosyltransferase
MKQFIDWATATTERRICLALLGLCVMIYIPLAGNYGMWDPWETHYGEVARQMLERNDFVSQWWPGSPQDRQEFWSKPVLTFWLMAISMKLFGLEWANASASQVADSWRVEWASRLPFVFLGILGIWATWELTRRLVGRRAGAFAAGILATSSQWALITRQAMTDMAFVAPMTVALSLAGLALLSPQEESEKEFARGEWKWGSRTLFSWPRATSFYVFAMLFVLSTLTQLIMISVQLKLNFRLGSYTIRTIGLVPMLPYFAAFFLGMWWCGRARNQRQIYLFIAYLMCALASLAKGPAGIALPGIVLIVYLVLSGRWRDLLFKLEIPRGVILFIACCFPWYHAMLIRHGMGFWNEFIGDNYVHRAGGRHGDRGTFEYYIQYTFYGMFPWSGFVTLGSLLSFRWLRIDEKRRGLAGFALVWFISEFTVLSLVNTKFHHYILPALPALAILAGMLIDELLSAPSRILGLALLFVGAPITFLSGYDLAAFPPRILWMFNYDYVNMPGTGRPWPTVAIWGNRYEYGGQLLLFAILATAGVIAFAILTLRAKPENEPPEPSSQPTQSAFLLILGGFVLALVLGILSGPASPNGAAPVIGRWKWLIPAILMLPFVMLYAKSVMRGWHMRNSSTMIWVFTMFAVVWSAFVIDKLLVELSPHWSQKHVIAAYYSHRSGPDEPLIAWQLYWRGENFYTRNEIYRSLNPNERTVFLGDKNAEKMQQYFQQHAGRRVFFVVERTRYEALRQLLPANAKSTLSIVDDTNCKLYLAVANI